MIIDTHIHLDKFADPEGWMRQWIAQGLDHVITPSGDADSLRTLLELKAAFPAYISVAAGVHPERPVTQELLHETEHMVDWIYAHHDEIIAIGEIGLPSYNLPQDGAVPPLAFEILDLFLACAADLDLPVILHAVHGSAAPCLEHLIRYGIRRAVFHWLKAPAAVQKEIRRAGYYASVSPELQTMKRDRTVAENFCPDYLLLETDGPEILRLPYTVPDEELIPADGCMTNSHPLLIRQTAGCMAQMYGISEEEILIQANRNALTFFQW